MKLEEASAKLNSLSGVAFSQLFTAEDLQTIRRNKGKTGQLLELALGLKLSSSNLDFSDGELKTNKCDKNGKPLETVFITQISSVIDELLTAKPFIESHLYAKIRNLLYVPVYKGGAPEQWMFLPSRHIDLAEPRFAPLFQIWQQDYVNICNQLKHSIETSDDGFIHTANGRHIQVRSKDAKDSAGRYHPIYSKTYGRYVSNKKHAFYFRKDFMFDLQKIYRGENLL